ncbi:hypothetical protein [Amycolatopsis sp.]|uniref:hypothetical protein n=1 Tax=Amycolatopsis sp. TaxID=37632 RepID=UPI002C55518C|nr:hypothetical protein [Amycolatopsis sp.]HVV13323.1 hypothetical protein [Amycolatopsis sp.]
MSTEPTTTPEAPPAWGDPQPPAPKWSGRKTAISAAVAVVIVAIGGVAIYLGTSSADSSQQGGMGGFPGGGRMGGMGQARGLASLASALHGDFTVSENGSYVTERMQSGEVSAISATSITVKSKDDYTQTYTIDSSTEKASNVASGSSVLVIAKVSGSTATATAVTDSSQAQQQGGAPGAQQGGRQGGFPGGQQSGQQGGFPAGGQGGMPNRQSSNN